MMEIARVLLTSTSCVRRTTCRDVIRLRGYCTRHSVIGGKQTPAKDVEEAKPFSEIPGPKWLRNMPLFGQRFKFYPFSKYKYTQEPLLREEMHMKYGSIYRERVGFNLWLVSTHDPHDVAAVFRLEGKYPNRGPTSLLLHVYVKRTGRRHSPSTLEGQDWYDKRHILQDLMARPKSATYYLQAQNHVTDDFVEFLRKIRTQDGQVPDLHLELFKYAAESIGVVCFNTRLGCLLPETQVDTERLISNTRHLVRLLRLGMQKQPLYLLFETPLYKQFKSVADGLFDFAEGHVRKAVEVVEGYRKSGRQEELGTHFLLSLIEQKGASVDDITPITRDMFLSGTDSTANSLAFLLYNIARSPDKQQKLYDEIRALLPSNESLTPETLERMTYLRACVKESFRLFYPLDGNLRVLQQDMVLSGYHVPKGAIVFMRTPIMCRSEKLFKLPGKYLPERWIRDHESYEENTMAARYSVMPFGHGRRNCLGKRFAEQELYLALVKVLQNFRLEHEGPAVGIRMGLFAEPDRPLSIRLYDR